MIKWVEKGKKNWNIVGGGVCSCRMFLLDVNTLVKVSVCFLIALFNSRLFRR